MRYDDVTYSLYGDSRLRLWVAVCNIIRTVCEVHSILATSFILLSAFIWHR